MPQQEDNSGILQFRQIIRLKLDGDRWRTMAIDSNLRTQACDYRLVIEWPIAIYNN